MHNACRTCVIAFSDPVLRLHNWRHTVLMKLFSHRLSIACVRAYLIRWVGPVQQ